MQDVKLSGKPVKATKPISVRVGNVTVKIYRVRTHGRPSFQVADYSSGKRQLISFSDESKARAEAGSIAAKLASREGDVLALTSQDRAAYLRALEVLKPTGTSIEMAANQFAEASKVLEGASLLEAARYYAKRHPSKLPRKTVTEVVKEFIDAKEQAGRSLDYLADLHYRCGRFAAAFQCGIGDVTGADIREFLNNLISVRGTRKSAKLSGRSVNNFRLAINTLFEFAKGRGYLPKDYDELMSIEAVDEVEGEIEIFTPSEMFKLLMAAQSDFVPALAIGGFAGLRSKEIERLDWSQIQIARGFIEVKAWQARKTRARRLVPILPNLAPWLAPYANQTGPVWPHSGDRFEAAKRETAIRAQVTWKHNALRHSFISYRLAEVKNENQVAMEAGNSPAMIHRHYRELVTPEEAKAWFSIAPERAANVTPMPAAAVH
jgi:integrase